MQKIAQVALKTARVGEKLAQVVPKTARV